MLLSTLPRSLPQCQQLRILHTIRTRRWFTHSPHSQKWGIFSDIHFQPDDLPRIVATSRWITSVFRDAGVTQILCLGDVLNTRESVNVQALSATVSFFDELKKIAPVHVVLGNHDMNLKHSARISSLDFLDMGDGAKVYREPTDMDVDGVKCLMLPWVENHKSIVVRLGQIPAMEKSETLLFGHLAVSGAIQSLSLSESSRLRRHTGVLTGKHLVGFKGVFLGHFHHHQRLDEKEPVWYVGAPMQHHFGDRGDDGRGVLLLDPTSVDKFEFVRHPNWDVYREIDLETLSMEHAYTQGLPDEFKGKRISLRCSPEVAPEFEDWRKLLMDAGAADVRRKLEVGRPILPLENVKPDGDVGSSAPTEPSESSTISAMPQEPEVFHGPSTEAFIEALQPFLASIQSQSAVVKPSEFSEYISAATRLMHISASSESSQASNSHLTTFSATLKTLTISNFLSVQGTLTIPFDTLQPGTWFVTGSNGTGKSMILEAITWCLFGRLLRSDMTAADAVNDVVRKNTAVRIDFENGCSVERLRNFSSRGAARKAALKLYKDGNEVEDFERGEYAQTQQALERDVIGCDFEMFSNSVVFGDQGKGAGNFLTLDKNERREILEELMGLGAFEGYLRTVKEERKLVEQERTQLNMTTQWNERELHRLKQELNHHHSIIAPKTAEKARYEAELKTLAVEEAAFEKEREGLDLERQETEVRKFHQLQKRSAGLEAELRSTREKARDADTSITRFSKKMLTGVCPTCHQPLIDKVHANKHLEELRMKKEAAEKRGKQLEEERIKLGVELEGYAGIMSSAQNTRRLLDKMRSLSVQRNNITFKLAKLSAELSISATRVPEITQQCEALSSKRKTASESLETLDHSLRILLFWETAFNKKPSTSTAPNMRHYLISTSIPELNELIADNLFYLSPESPLAVYFTPDLSLNPPSAFGKRSSGQRKRNNLAVLFALFQLTRQKSRFRADFIMLDEVFDALDSDGQQHARELIECVTEQGNVQHVFVVTHSEKMEDITRVGSGGNKVLKVSMTERGTVIEDPNNHVTHEWDAEEELARKKKASKKGPSEGGEEPGPEQKKELGNGDEEPKPKRKRASKKKLSEENEEPSEGGDEPKPKRKRASKKKLSEENEEPIEGDEEPKPKQKRASKKKLSEENEEPIEGGEEPKPKQKRTRKVKEKKDEE